MTLSECLNEFPRTWIATCEKHPLRDDGVVLEKMLIARDVAVQRKHYNGFGHYFWRVSDELLLNMFAFNLNSIIGE